MNNETSYFLRSPIGRVVLDPKFGDFALDVVNILAERFRAAEARLAASFIHGFYIHATIALP